MTEEENTDIGSHFNYMKIVDQVKKYVEAECRKPTSKRGRKRGRFSIEIKISLFNKNIIEKQFYIKIARDKKIGKLQITYLKIS